MKEMTFGKLDAHSKEDIKTMEDTLKKKFEANKTKDKKDSAKKIIA